MKYNIDIVMKALECCTTKGRSACDECPLKDECESNPFESAIAKHSFELVKDLMADKNGMEELIRTAVETQNRMADTIEKLTEERDTFKEAFYNYQNWVNSIGAYEFEGYERSAAKAMAEMDMWRSVALEKKKLEDEIEHLKEIPEQLYKEMSDRMREEVRITKKYTARRIHTNLMRYTESVGEHTIDNPLAETHYVVREEDIDRVINEVLE